jgi:hypothetical protein
MYLFRIFYSFLPLRNPIGFGASDLLILAIALVMIALLVAKAWLAPYVHKLAGQTIPCMTLLFASVILLRLALFGGSPAPVPSGADDFGYLLLGDTIAHLRFANPTHPLHPFFESVFILQQPAYASIYPLGQGFVLALGQLAGSPWIGVLLSGAAFCALCYWMLRGWIAPVWALAGGLLAVIQFGPLNSWMNSYWGGYVSAMAGCLVFGALPRLSRTPRVREGLLLGLGIGLQMLSRPFEAIFLVAGSALYLAFKVRTRKPLFGALAVGSLSLVLIGFQNKAVTENWTTMPYVLSRFQYGVPATLTFQPNPIPHRQLTAEQELDYKAQAAVHGDGTDSLPAYFQRLFYRFRYLRFFLLPPLFFAVLACSPSLRQRRYLWVFGSILLFALGSNFYPYFYPHYIAAMTCLLLLVTMQGLAQMGASARSFVVVLSVGSFVFWFGLYAGGNDDLLRAADYQSWNYVNRGDPQGRKAVNAQLSGSGRQLVFVRYAPFHRFEEWVHNDADIDQARIVWANDLGAEENQKLVRYYPDRKAWLLEPDVHPPALVPYPTVH